MNALMNLTQYSNASASVFTNRAMQQISPKMISR